MNSDLQPYPEKLTFLEKVQLYLFDDPDKIPSYHQFTEHELKVKKRYSLIFSYWLDKPTLSERKLINYLVNEHSYSKSMAYKDVGTVKVLLGNVRNATKEWQRYKLIAILDRAIELAEAKKDVKNMILAADKLGKYTQLDKEDSIRIPYDEIVPQNFEITGDVSVLGIEPIPNLQERQKRMREKYTGGTVEDAEILSETKDG